MRPHIVALAFLLLYITAANSTPSHIQHATTQPPPMPRMQQLHPSTHKILWALWSTCYSTTNADNTTSTNATLPSTQHPLPFTIQHPTTFTRTISETHIQKTSTTHTSETTQPRALYNVHHLCTCPLYTSDAADQSNGIDLGTRRIFIKQTRNQR